LRKLVNDFQDDEKVTFISTQTNMNKHKQTQTTQNKHKNKHR